MSDKQGCGAMKYLAILLFAWLSLSATSTVPVASIYRVLQSLPVPATDDPEERAERLRGVARVISDVARNRHEAAALIALGKHESAFAEFVGRGCALIPATVKATCDRGRARSYWQMWQRACPAGWAFERGDPAALPVFAECAVKHWRFAERACAKRPNHGRVEGAFAGFRTTTRCDWGPSKKRAVTYRNILGRL